MRVLTILVVAGLASPASANLLVWQDAKLYVEPSDSAPSIQLGTFKHGTRDQRIGEVVPMVEVREVGDSIEVIPYLDVECGSTIMVSYDLKEPHLFVKRGD